MKKLVLLAVLALACNGRVWADDSWVPAGYGELSYAIGPGNAVVDTGFLPDNTVEVQFKVAFSGIENYSGVFGNYVDENTSVVRLIPSGSSTTQFLVHFFTRASGGAYLYTLAKAGDPMEGYIRADGGEINGTSFNFSGKAAGNPNSTTLKLFSAKSTAASATKIWYLKILDSSKAVIHEYVPVQNLTTGDVKMYDKAAAQFLTTTGGPLAAGPREPTGNLFKVGDTRYNTMADAFAAALPVSGTIELLGDADFDTQITPAVADLAGKTVTIKSAAGHQYRLKTTADNAGFVFGAATSKFSLRFQDVIIDGGAVWSSETLTDLANIGVTRAADFIQINKNDYVYFDGGVVVENFNNKNKSTSYWVVQGMAWSSYLYATAGDFVARNIRGGGFINMGQNRRTFFCGTVTNNYATADALMYHPGNNAGEAEYYDGTRICSNVVATGKFVMKLDLNWPNNSLRFGKTTDTKTFVYIYDNFEVGGVKRADINLVKANTIKQQAPFDPASRIGIAYPATEPEGVQLGICAYKGSDDKHQEIIRYDYNPYDDVTFIGHGGDNIVWTDESTITREPQDPVFAVSTDGGTTWLPTLYPYLEEAVAVATGVDNVIELTADAFFDTTVTFAATNITLRSRGMRRTLRRSKSASLNVMYVASAKNDDRTLTVTNLVLDGGANWSDSEDFSSRAMEKGSMKTPIALFTLNGQTPAWNVTNKGILELCNDVLIRNTYVDTGVISFVDTSNHSGILRMYEGAVIRDCRGSLDSSAVIYTGNNGGEIYVDGGTITRCGMGSIVRRAGISYKAYVGSPVITNNLVSVAALSQYALDHNSGNCCFVFTGGAPVVRDNVNGSGVPRNALTAIPSLFSGSLMAGADVRLGLVTTGGSETSGLVTQQLGETNGVVTVDGFTGAEFIRHQDSANGFWRAKAVVDGATTNLVWAQVAIAGETVAMPADTVLSGDLHVATGGRPVDRGASYTLIAGENLSGTFDNVTFDPAIGRNRHVKYTDKAVLCNPSGLLLIVR